MQTQVNKKQRKTSVIKTVNFAISTPEVDLQHDWHTHEIQLSQSIKISSKNLTKIVIK